MTVLHLLTHTMKTTIIMIARIPTTAPTEDKTAVKMVEDTPSPLPSEIIADVGVDCNNKHK